jgi:tetratricopeptide (TPR) repeat protein
MPSKDFEEFLWSCFPKTFGEAHEGLHEGALLRLQGDERIEAERLILAGIGKTWNSNNTIEAAGYLRLQSASKLLKQELRKAQIDRFIESIILFPFYFFRYENYYERIVKLAWSLYQIEKYPKSLNIIISILESPRLRRQKYSFTQMIGFLYLISFGDEPDAIRFLNKCVHTRNFARDALYALESIKDGQRLPWHSEYQKIRERVEKILERQNNPTWQWIS